MKWRIQGLELIHLHVRNAHHVYRTKFFFVFFENTDMFFHLSTPSHCLSIFQVGFKLLAANRPAQCNLLHMHYSVEMTMTDLFNDNNLS